MAPLNNPNSFHVSSNAVQVAGSVPGVMVAYYLDNTANAATTYFQFFFAAPSAVTLGTTAPAFVVPVPAGLAANLFLGEGIGFNVLSFAATTTYNGSTAPASPVDCTLFLRK